MKRSLLSRLRSNGAGYLISACILILGLPLYQFLILAPQGYNSSLSTQGADRYSAYLAWIGNHTLQFLGYRLLLLLAFALLLTLPYSLYRIIVAQELLGQEERAAEPSEEDEDKDADEETSDGLPQDAWRGKGFAVLAVWSGFAGFVLYLLGSTASTLYLLVTGNGYTTNQPLPANFGGLSSIFTITANTVGIGLLALTTLLFGAMIARAGRNLWPGIWVAFGYCAIAITALLSGSAVGVASAPGEGQAPLTSPAIFLLGLWVGWLGFMLTRLTPEVQEASGSS